MRLPERPPKDRYRWLPLAVIVAGTVFFFASGLHRAVTLDLIQSHRGTATAWITSHRGAAALLFIAAYALATVFLPPSGTTMTVIGGFLFGTVAGTVITVIGATLGAVLVFLAARYSLRPAFRNRAGPWLNRLEAGFRENQLNYMLVLRLVPLFPFWLVNIAPALFGVDLRTYLIATFLGIIPGTAIYASFGAGLGAILDSDEPISLNSVMTPEIVAALTGLALLSLAPAIYRHWQRRRQERERVQR
jgi:uncharacterized membrane protein YdjX (TVP38/TMEM64 family)